ncbi:MAG: ABC transporter ATP-binding protein, partial [Chitinophagaceae bacterium]|nr:ABC transporter ATP-binding protein [Chitinophagaceae bacterium]
MEKELHVQNTLRRILTLLKLERAEISAVYFYAILNGLIQLSLPLGVQAIIGLVLGASISTSLVVLIALVVVGVLFSGIMQVNQMKIIEKIQQKLFVRYSFQFINQLHVLDLKRNDNLYLPELMNRFFDIPVLQKSLSKILLDIPAASIQVLFGLLLLSFYHPVFIVFGLVLITLLVLILRYTGQQALQSSIQESNFKFRTAGWLQETARAINSIKLAKNNDIHVRRLDVEVSSYLDARNTHFKTLLFQYNVLVIFKTIITAAMLIVGTYLMLDQKLTVGQFIAAEIVIIMVLNSVEKLIANLATVYDTVTAKEKIASVTEKPVEKNGNLKLPHSDDGLKLQLQKVGFSYNDRDSILSDISFSINPNETVCVRGADSSGKTTLLKLLAGAYPDFSGVYLLNNVPLGNYDLISLRANTGLLLDEQEIFHGTLWENITLDNQSISTDTLVGYAIKTGLSEFVETLPKGYDTLLDPTGRRLPRSVVTKILLVRALANEPRLLLLEDPWQYCTNEQRGAIIKILLERKNATVVVFTNDEQFAQQCDKIIVLGNNGTISSITQNTKG